MQWSFPVSRLLFVLVQFRLSLIKADICDGHIGGKEIKGHCFLPFYNGKNTWSDSMDNCAQVAKPGTRGRLAHLTSKLKWKESRVLLWDIGKTIWIGLQVNKAKWGQGQKSFTDFVWVDSAGYPNQTPKYNPTTDMVSLYAIHQDQNCAYYLKHSGGFYQVGDHSCYDKNGRLCEFLPTASASTSVHPAEDVLGSETASASTSVHPAEDVLESTTSKPAISKLALGLIIGCILLGIIIVIVITLFLGTLWWKHKRNKSKNDEKSTKSEKQHFDADKSTSDSSGKLKTARIGVHHMTAATKLRDPSSKSDGSTKKDDRNSKDVRSESLYTANPNIQQTIHQSRGSKSPRTSNSPQFKQKTKVMLKKPKDDPSYIRVFCSDLKGVKQVPAKTQHVPFKTQPVPAKTQPIPAKTQQVSAKTKPNVN